MKKRDVRSIQAGFYAALVLLAGAITAVLAHAAIDFAGDFLLAHDTYDGIAHQSRGIFGGIAVAIGAIVVLRFLYEALDRRCVSLTALLRRLRAARGSSAWRFVALVVAAGVVALLAMEWFDAVMAGVRIDGVDDLLGGSPLLGLGTATSLGVAIAWLVRWMLHVVADWEPAIAAFVARLLERGGRGNARYSRAGVPLTLSLDGACRLARRSGKRAPPFATPA